MNTSFISDDDILKAMYAGDARRVVELFARRVGKWPMTEEDIDQSVAVIQATIKLPVTQRID